MWARISGTTLRRLLVYRWRNSSLRIVSFSTTDFFKWSLSIMGSDASKSTERILVPPDETIAVPTSHDEIAKRLRGFGPLGILAILVILAGNGLFAPLSAILVLVWVWRSHTPWREIGYVRPRSWTRTLIVGIVFGIAFKLLMKAIVMPLLGAPPINQAFHYLEGNTAALPG